MSIRGAYILSNAIWEAALLIAAAYFHNGWSVFFIFLVVVQSFAYSYRLKKWEDEL